MSPFRSLVIWCSFTTVLALGGLTLLRTLGQNADPHSFGWLLLSLLALASAQLLFRLSYFGYLSAATGCASGLVGMVAYASMEAFALGEHVSSVLFASACLTSGILFIAFVSAMTAESFRMRIGWVVSVVSIEYLAIVIAFTTVPMTTSAGTDVMMSHWITGTVASVATAAMLVMGLAFQSRAMKSMERWTWRH